MENQETKKYEFAYWVKSDASQEKLESINGEIKALLEKLGGTIAEEKEAMRKPFAYPIKHYIEGLFKILIIEISPEKIEDLHRNLKLNSDVLRHTVDTFKVKRERSEKETTERVEEPVKQAEKEAPTPEAKPTIKEEKKEEEPKPKKEKEEELKEESKEEKKEEVKEGKEEVKLEDVDKKLEEILGDEL